MKSIRKWFKENQNHIARTAKIAWPAVLESFFVAFVGIVDSMMVSRLGEYAVAAVGLTTQPKFIGLAVFIATNVAVSALVARRRGPIIHFAGSEADTHESAVAYFRLIMGGMMFNIISLAINAAQRGSGNTKIALRTNLTSNIVNVCFNFLLIEGRFGFPAWGVQGAWALCRFP